MKYIHRSLNNNQSMSFYNPLYSAYIEIHISECYLVLTLHDFKAVHDIRMSPVSCD